MHCDEHPDGFAACEDTAMLSHFQYQSSLLWWRPSVCKLAMWKMMRVNYMTLASLMCLYGAVANLVNISIDDQYGDAVTGWCRPSVPTYLGFSCNLFVSLYNKVFILKKTYCQFLQYWQ